MKSRAMFIAAWNLVLLLLASCASSGIDQSTPPAPPSSITIAGRYQTRTIALEIADEPEEHAKGLMDRPTLAANSGMLFIFTDDAERPFWMHNTHFSLDIIHLDADRRIVGIIRRAKPDSDEQLRVAAKSRYVLEVEGGFCDRVGIREGDQLTY